MANLKNRGNAIVSLLLISCFYLFASYANALDYYVSPTGSDQNPGTTKAKPFQTVQHALQLTQPGDQIVLAAGEYWEDVRSVRSGKPDAPIRIVGSSGSGSGSSTIKGAGAGRVIELNHSYITLTNLTIDGKRRNGRKAAHYRDKLIYIMGKNKQGVTGIKLTYLILQNAGGECLRMKYFAHHNEIAYSRFYNCGVWDFQFKKGGKNGEAVYIGTAPEQLGRNPSKAPDASNYNWIHHNSFDTRGNECVDVKEAVSYTLVEHNECTGQRDPQSAGMSSRGNYTVFRFNSIWGNAGAGVRLGGDKDNQGIYNEVYGNTLWANEYSSFKIMRVPQTKLCGNTIRSGNTEIVRGKHARGIDPRQPC